MGTLQCLNAILQRETTFITSRFPGRRNLYKWGYSFKCKNLLQGSKLFCIRIDSIEKGAGGVGRGGGGGGAGKGCSQKKMVELLPLKVHIQLNLQSEKSFFGHIINTIVETFYNLFR